MSGIEVAGLVLGAIPLIISAMESYNEGLDPVKSFMNWKGELPQFIRKLRNQHVHYAQTTRMLLEPITTEFELAEMLSEPGGQLWKDEDMSGKLKDKLQESYHAYQSTMADIERIMKKIALKLDLDRAAELTRNDLEAILVANPKKDNDKFEFRKRVRFGMSKKTIKALLEELDECNKELERFTNRSEKLETYRKATKPSFATRLQQIQSYAKNLHGSLLSSWSCSCRSYHRTNGVHPWNWQVAEIHVDEDYVPPTPPMTKPKMTKSVSFGSKPPPPYSVVSDPATSLTQSLREVDDLCASIQQLYKSSPCIGFSFDSKKKLRGVYALEGNSEAGIASCEVVTLNELLETPPVVNGRPAKLSKKERYSLAVTLASSTLQLNNTPWFPDQFGAKDILFHRTSAGPRLIDIEHPYVTSRLNELSKDVLVSPKPRGFHNKNMVLLALAVALLELYFGVSVEKHQELEHGETKQPSDLNPWNLCAMAYEWTDGERENLSAAFLGAITHCLRCFSDPAASLSDSEFLQAAVEGIVLPLQDELSQFLGKTTP
ncbi:hypothetical protein K504DRAFT_365978 [Pleomassaria siparia CBS 279.74]|uniref:DUF7580 domain-containing protein n=1 Tax=Pleomassaria siparia CBS 279.74 TaxID=1314801 RepID=A0A6G1KRE9_9PLEO|nr:hypothetical protein K504DRAFT_365978 [Pleomassaria siparia CBS 279.74]